MSYNRSFPVAAAGDLSAKQYMAMAIGGDVAGTALTALGLLADKPRNAGEHASVIYDGRAKFRSGAAVAAGARLTVAASGYLTGVTSGPSVGFALEAVASGGIAEGIFNFAALNLAGG